LASRANLLLFWKERHQGQVGQVDSLTRSGVKAMAYAKNALEQAILTDHTRLVVRSHVAVGLSHVMSPYYDRFGAEEELAAAMSGLHPETRDYVWDEVKELEYEIGHGADDPDRVVFQLTAAEVIGRPLGPNVAKLEKLSARLTKNALNNLAETKESLGIGFSRLKRITGDDEDDTQATA
jgi:hypothetical protein